VVTEFTRYTIDKVWYTYINRSWSAGIPKKEVEMSVALAFKCSKCGAKTDWDFDLGPSPLCTSCWDSQVEIIHREKVAAYQRDYRQRNREKAAANKRDYRQRNREKAAAYRRDYYQRNREKVAAYRRDYYQRNREKAAANRRDYYQRNREKVACCP